ncbi:hypothetical protein OVA24_06795 [Luteolibacter sp. SL250]|uniref:hypothetical protein n=1 Tax=Luteolibacter sp. SL250 TaxID=2995170 RepID=UPI0022718534|nr:hypothetical protein [Luteolibacter sp. SL250]WAC21089.1 hypothetical protein OVA24_06795 [Luteolibacter sp. SL250]
MIPSKDMEKYHIPFAAKVTKEGAEKIWKDMKVSVHGLSVRQARALVVDSVNRSLGIDKEAASAKQRDTLAKFGQAMDLSKGQAQAVITDIYESLGLEVARYEGLFSAEKVIHVYRREEVTEILSFDSLERIRLKGCKGACTLRMLRRYRPDGCYSQTSIPVHYFENGWLMKVV